MRIFARDCACSRLGLPFPHHPMSEQLQPQSEREETLSSWKAIAVYLGRSVRAVQNWEKEEGLPVHRHRHVDGATVFAYRAELDAWLAARSPRATGPAAAEVATSVAEPVARPRDRRAVWLGAALLAIALAGIAIALARPAREHELHSLAVLPLRPIGPDAGVEHLGVGIADAIVQQLAAAGSIDVRPASAAQLYARSRDLRAAASDLGVDAILEGTIQRSGERIRVRIHLVDVRRNAPVFSAKFDEEAADLFAVEDTISGAVARALAIEADPRSSERERSRRSRVPGAYEAYLKGRVFWSKRTPEGIRSSIEQYEEAIARDPSYAAAYAALGESLNLLSMHRIVAPKDAFPRAKEAASRALALDGTLADAHVARGTAAFYYDWDWVSAEEHLRRAIELDPRHASARHVLANLMVATGRRDEAVATMAEAMRDDPMSVTLISVAAFQLYQIRRYDDGIRKAREALDRDSGYVQAYQTLGTNFLGKGRYDDGVASFERLAALLGPESYGVAELACAYAQHPARRSDAVAMKPKLLALLEKRRISPFDMARYHALLGEKREALERLDETMAARDSGMVWIASDPRFDGLRDDPRFHRLVRAMGLEDAEARYRKAATARARPRAGLGLPRFGATGEAWKIVENRRFGERFGFAYEHPDPLTFPVNARDETRSAC